jgi:hypothetical protein
MKELMDAYGCDREDAKTILLLLFTGGFDRWVETRNIDFNKCVDIVKIQTCRRKPKELKRMHQFRIDIKNIQYAIFNANPHILKRTNQKKSGKQIILLNCVSVCATRVEVVCWSVFINTFIKKYIKDDVCVVSTE